VDVISKEKYLKLYKMLDVSPIEGDCGKLCNEVCCKVKNSDFGIYLLPNEDSIFTGKEEWLIWEKHSTEDYDFPPSWQGEVFFIRCQGFCPRDKRPLQCRTFPLAPHIDEMGKLHVIWETLELPYKCPLIENNIELNPLFIERVFSVWKELIKNSLIKDLVIWDSKQRTIDGTNIVSLKSD